MQFLYFLEDLRCGALNVLMEIFTRFGSEILFYAVAMAVLWCVDKREGAYVLFTGFFGTVANQTLKLACRVPRPWERDPNFTIVESARAEATGYSFPSGHSQNAGATYGALARCTKKRWLRISCAALIVLVCFSRMYLGVHTPADVLVGLGMSLILVLVFYPLVFRAFGNTKRMALLLGVSLAVAAGFVAYVHLQTGLPAERFAEAQKVAYSIFGALLGYIPAYFFEQKFVRYRERAVWYVQLCKLAFGLALLLCVKSGTKELLALLGQTQLFWNVPRYCLTVFFAVGIWPMSFAWLERLLTKKGARA